MASRNRLTIPLRVSATGRLLSAVAPPTPELWESLLLTRPYTVAPWREVAGGDCGTITSPLMTSPFCSFNALPPCSGVQKRRAAQGFPTASHLDRGPAEDTNDIYRVDDHAHPFGLACAIALSRCGKRPVWRGGRGPACIKRHHAQSVEPRNARRDN